MRRRVVLLAMALLLLSAGIAFGADPNMGTWKLNDAKSKIGTGAAKYTSVVYDEAADGTVKVTVEGTAADGSPTHNEWTGKFDGKYYPVTGDPNQDARSYKKITDRALELNTKKGDKVTTTGRIVVSADGKMRTVTTSGTNAQGQKFTSKAVYDKQ